MEAVREHSSFDDNVMKSSRTHWHGGLALTCVATFVAFGHAADPDPVRTRVVDIAYTVNDAALPLESVTLWFTLDGGRSWTEYGRDDDRQSPITFQASQEGAYGFFVVLRNAAGASSGMPTPGTRPHAEAFIDATEPVVQLHPIHSTTSLGRRVLQIQWTALDANLLTRPIEIDYQRPPEDRWYPATAEPLANTGRFDWAIPETMSGAIAVRVTATDLGGHRVASRSQTVEIAPASSVASLMGSAPVSRPDPINTPTVLSGSARARNEAAKLFSEAMGFRERGEFREGIDRLRKAVRLDPLRADAFAEMADMFYRIGDMERAMGAYELALKQQPTMRAALRGAAMVHRQRNDLAAAADMLRTILRYNPNDAEVWMNLGDIAVYQGDEVLARECYTRATRIDPNAVQVVAEAQRRLDVMSQASRTYRPIGN